MKQGPKRMASSDGHNKTKHSSQFLRLLLNQGLVIDPRVEAQGSEFQSQQHKNKRKIT